MKGGYIFLFIVIITLQFRCKKLVTVTSPTTALTSGNVYDNDVTAAAVLTGIYTSLSSTSTSITASNIYNISLASGLSADEITLYGGSANSNTVLAQYYLNKLTAGIATTQNGSVWNDFYAKIYIVNLALENLSQSLNLTQGVRQQLLGEGHFLRAFFYFYLINLYGNVPLTTTSDYRINAVLPRSPKTQIYQQIIADLKDAQILLSDGYVTSDAKSGTTDRLRPNKWAATSLLARVYLYNGDWAYAEEQASSVISNTSTYGLGALNSTFLKNSKEAILQLQPVNAGWNTWDAMVFVLPNSGPTSNSSVQGHPVYLSLGLINSFEAGDKRKINWVGSVIVNGTTYYYPYKYQSAILNAPVTEYLTVLRLGEQYLVRAEARAQQGNITGAQSDLNTIRNRAGLPNTTANDKNSLLSAILHERQIELFTEWGNRWLDLKRTGNVDGVMTVVAPIKGTTWSTNWQLYPIPLYELTQDANLIQNPGY